MTSSNGNIFRVTGPLCGEFTGPGEFPTQRPVTRSFDVLFDLRLNKRLSKQSRGWWFETPSLSLWRQRNAVALPCGITASYVRGVQNEHRCFLMPVQNIMWMGRTIVVRAHFLFIVFYSNDDCRRFVHLYVRSNSSTALGLLFLWLLRSN